MIYVSEPTLSIRPCVNATRQSLMVADTREELLRAVKQLETETARSGGGNGLNPRRYLDDWRGFAIILTPQQAGKILAQGAVQVDLRVALLKAVPLGLPHDADTARRSHGRVLTRRHGRHRSRTA